ncbi:carbonyl reductase [NADPH] 3-like [Danaus plexippus]|uniref:carbonyl reductase [NADPH] 3-like n=1 Tax=Danaus plexippus TaxID=13037 RepID=UPI002AB23B20|nr:carbonyl reductase [NADPH] 3-like [Danaus plexippus]XP_061380165.1 carbonyl reductase [NADPH] 3-like [Danaus plexippus]
MSEKVAIVTGANKGLGLAIVKKLCENYEGTVYLTSRDEKRGYEACEQLRELDIKPQYHQLDITDSDSIEKFCFFIRSHHKNIDLLINNAGILFLKDCQESKLYQAEQTLYVNFFALVNFTEAVLPLMSDHSTILNISSSSGHLSRLPSVELRQRFQDPKLNLEGLKFLMREYIDAVKLNNDVDSWGSSPYVVSKIGVNAYTFMLNRRLESRDVKVNCVHPGYVMSDMTRGAGSVTPDQAAQICVDLALNPDGGGLYVWHNGAKVQWDGKDPRSYIDGKTL